MKPPPHLFTTTDLFKKIKTTLKDLSQNHPNLKKVLDAPAGGGALSQYLKEELSMDVVAADIDEKKWDYTPVPFVCADLGRALPFEKESFDLVVCLEGLKHFTDVSTAISEMTRILKPNGLLVLTIPNDLCMQTRLRYFFDGFVDTDWHYPLDVSAPESKNFLYVHSLVSLPYLYYFLTKNKLKLLQTATSRLRTKSILLAALFYPLIYFFTWKACSKNRTLLKELTSWTCLAGRHNILVCQKESPHSQRPALNVMAI